ncbi:polysaccharide deacetylase family protein [Paenibacillus polymyxa]|nr:polysaccharide deacetylase family protein [Paenibacillus polymyxa]
MDEENLIQLHEEGHIVGLHSHSHPTSMNKLSEAQQISEYTQNYNYLKKLLGIPPKSMSHPCNSYNQDTISVLGNLQIDLGFRANMVENHYTKYEFPREDHTNIIKEMYKIQ